MKRNDIIDRLKHLKQLLTYTSIIAMICLFAQVLVLVFSFFMLLKANRTKFSY
jgi:hypothetical protein